MNIARPENVQPHPVTPSERQAALIALGQCSRSEMEAEKSVYVLNMCYSYLHDPEIAAAWNMAAKKVVDRVCVLRAEEISSGLYVHMTVFSLSTARLHMAHDLVDDLLISWLRHPRSFNEGSIDGWVGLYYGYLIQRVADMLGWQKLSVVGDKEALMRFASWVGRSKDAKKLERHCLASMRAIERNFPAPRIWGRFRIPNPQKPKLTHPAL